MRKMLLMAATIPLLSLGALMTPAGAQAVSGQTRYASPVGFESASCPKAFPCDIVTAINGAASGDQVVIEPGNYDKVSPLTTTLTDTAGSLEIHGEVGKPRPVIYSAATKGISLTDSTLSDVEVRYSGPDMAIADTDDPVDHVVVVASTTSIGCYVGNALYDSLCASTAAGSVALELGPSPTELNSVRVLRGVTAEAPGTNSAAIYINQESENLTMDATNVIAHGAEDDLALNSGGGTTVVNITHSDYLSTTGVDAGTTINTNATDIHSAPKFIDPAAANYRERLGSPTINKGAADPAADTDAAGNPRTIGSAPDMGAYEYPQKPVAAHLNTAALTTHSVQMSVKVNAEGLATSVTLVAILGRHHVTSRVVSAGKGRTAKTVHVVLRGLKLASKYRMHVVASNSAGHVDSTTKTVRTKTN